MNEKKNDSAFFCGEETTPFSKIKENASTNAPQFLDDSAFKIELEKILKDDAELMQKLADR